MITALLWIMLGLVLMECFSWWIHKYIMHGVLWEIHKTHHRQSKGYFELNDLFTVIFGGAAIVLIFLGIESLDYRFWLGCGISLYGMLYFILHDVLIHKRLNLLGRPKSKYLQAIAKAHRAHHKSKEKEDGESFGLFLIPKKYFREEGDI
ncbi:sterol desaturase family protein [Roseivirga echinicomitans]